MWLAATNSFSLGSGLGTHCNRKRRLNAAVLRVRLLLSPHSSHLDTLPGFPPLWARGETPLTRTFSSRTMVGGAAEPRLQAVHRDRCTG